MAITLPDFTALPQVTPQPSGNLAQYPSTDAGAQGLATLGKGLEAAGGAATDIAAYQDIARTKADRAMAEADLLGRTIKLDAALKTETDPEKITALSNAYQEALDTSSQAIGNPEARSLWLAQNSHKVAQGQAQAYLRNTDVYRDNYLAGADAQFTSLTNIATSHEDPATRADAQQKIGALIEGMRASGTISAAKAAEMTDKVAHGIIIGRSDYLDATGRSREALENLRRNGQYVPAAILDERSERYQKRDIVRGGQALADRVSGTGGGATGLVPYTPSTDLLSGTGLTPDQYQTYRSYLASREQGSQGYGTPPNAGGYTGRYQLGQKEIAETAARLGVPVPSTQQFLSNPDLQEKFLENYTLDHHNSLMQQSEAYRNASPTERAGILMGAHLGGVGGVTRYLNSGGKDNPADANGTTVGDYVGSMRRAMSGAPAAGPAAQVAADVASGGTAAPAATAGPARPGKFDLAGGSSIAVGLNTENGLQGVSVADVSKPEAALADAAGSRNVQGGIDYIKTHPERFAGKNVLWTTGIENTPGGDAGRRAALPKVAEQLDALKAAGAANVVLAGVNQGRDASLNPELAKIAADKKVPFAGALPSSDIHPSRQGYKNYHDHAERLLPQGPGAAPAAVGPSAAAAQPGVSSVAARIAAPGAPVQLGNIDLSTMPGGSTTLASAVPVDITSGPLQGKQILLPTIAADGSVMTRDQALDQYDKTGEHLGVFNSTKAATAYGQQFGRAPAVPRLPGESGGGNGGDNAPATAGTDEEQPVESGGGVAAATATTAGADQPPGRGAASPAAPTGTPATPAAGAPPAVAPAPLDIDTRLQQRLKAIEDDRVATPEQKDVAERLVRSRYQREKAGANDAINKAQAQITRLTQTAASHDDPVQRDAAAQNIDSIINGLRSSGYITQDQADIQSDKSVGDVVVARADYLDASGDPAAARQYLEERSKLVPPAELDKRMHTFRDREKVQGGEALAAKVSAANAPPTAPDQLPPGTPDAVSQSQAARAQTINLETGYQQQLKDIEADPTAGQDQKDIASRIVTARYQRAKAAISDQTRKEASAVKSLINADLSSISNTGQPIAELTTERVRNALGDDKATEFEETRTYQQQYYDNFHDMANLTQPEIDARLAATKPVPATRGFDIKQKVFDFAMKTAGDLRKQRITDPAGSVATLPDVQEAAKTASLERPETFMPLVAARSQAMDRVGIPEENQVPITRAEAQELWKPIGLATETGDINAINAQLTDVIKRLQTATQDQSDKALQAVLREGHAGTQTKGIAASMLRKLARGEAATQAETKAFDDAQKNDAAMRAAGPVSPAATTPRPEYTPQQAAPGSTRPEYQPQPTVAPAPPPVTFPAPPERAIETLRAKPESAAQFNEVFGPGSAEKVLQIVRPGAMAPPPAAVAPAAAAPAR